MDYRDLLVLGLGIFFAGCGIAAIAALIAAEQLHTYARMVVAAVYRAAIHTARALYDESLEWLTSPAGIAYRRLLAAYAYDVLPAYLRGFPIGVIKLVVTKELFVTIVDRVFQEMTVLATTLERAPLRTTTADEPPSSAEPLT